MGSEPAAQVFRRDGEFWTIASAGKEIRLRDIRGLHYLATLLREHGREFPVTDPVRFANGMPLTRSAEDPVLSVVSGLGDAGKRLDARGVRPIASGCVRSRPSERKRSETATSAGSAVRPRSARRCWRS